MYSPLRVLIVAADPLARAGLARFVAEQEPCEVVGQLASPAAWEDVLAVYRPEVVLWDWGWDGYTAAFPSFTAVELPVLLLLATTDLFPAALQAGAQGVLLREVGGEQLTAALTALTHNLLVLDPAYSPQMAPMAEEMNTAEPLSQREQEVLRHLATGQTNKAIAQALAISPHTVKFHVTAIMAKLNAQSRTEAVALATRAGLLPL